MPDVQIPMSSLKKLERHAHRHRRRHTRRLQISSSSNHATSETKQQPKKVHQRTQNTNSDTPFGSREIRKKKTLETSQHPTVTRIPCFHRPFPLFPR